MSILSKLKEIIFGKKTTITQVQATNNLNTPNKNDCTAQWQGITISEDKVESWEHSKEDVMKEIFDEEETVCEREEVKQHDVSQEGFTSANEELIAQANMSKTDIIENGNSCGCEKEAPCEPKTPHMFFQCDKDDIADILRPIVKSYNNDLFDEYKNAISEPIIKVLKTYVIISSDGFEIIARFTQDNEYNKGINDFVREYIFEDFYKKFDNYKSEFYTYSYEIINGHIHIRRYLAR